MFKNETLVKWVVCSLMALPVNLWAQATTPTPSVNTNVNNPRPCTEETSLNELKKEIRKLKGDIAAEEAGAKDAAKISSLKAQLIAAEADAAEAKQNYDRNCTGGQSGANCGNAAGNFEKAKGELVGACRSLPQHGPSKNTAGPNGNIGCAFSLAQCSCSALSVGDPKHSALDCGSVDKSGRGTDEGKRAHLALCAIDASKDLEKLEKDVKDQQKELRELQKRLPELEQAKADAESQAREKMQQADEKMADAAKTRAQQRSEFVKQQREAMKSVAQQVTNLQEQISKNEETRSQLNADRTNALISRGDAIAGIENECHASAVNDVNKRQTMAAELTAGRAYNRGGFNQMLRNVGVSDRTQWQRVAKKFFDQCMQSAITRSKIKSANARYDAMVDNLRSRDRDIDNKRAGLLGQIAQLQSANGCSGGGTGVNSNGSNAETQACQAVRQLTEDIAKAEGDYRAQMLLAANQKRNAGADGQRRASAKQQEINQARAAAAEEDARLRNMRALLKAKQDGASGNMDARDANDVWQKYGNLVGAATYLNGCDIQPTSCGTSCQEAAGLLDVLGIAHRGVNGTSTSTISGPSGSNTNNGTLSNQLGTTPGNGTK